MKVFKLLLVVLFILSTYNCSDLVDDFLDEEENKDNKKTGSLFVVGNYLYHINDGFLVKELGNSGTKSFSKDRLAIGVPGEDKINKETGRGILDLGAVYLFDRNYKLIKKLVPESSDSKIFFGGDVLWLGEKLIVSCVYEKVNGIEGAGAVYIFDKNGNLIKKLVANKPYRFCSFGEEVAVSENRIIVYTRGKADSKYESGEVYLFNQDGELIKTITAETPKMRGRFGRKLGIFQDTLVVVPENEVTTLGIKDFGEVYLFNLEDGSLIKKLSVNNPEQDGRFNGSKFFGSAFAVSGDKIVIGAFNEDIDGKKSAGAAYLYDKNGNLIKKLVSEKPNEWDYFGKKIVASENTILVCADLEDYGTVKDAGVIHLFDNNGNFIKRLTSKRPESRPLSRMNKYEIAMATKGDRILLGFPEEDAQGVKNSGIIYILDSKGNFIRAIDNPKPVVDSYFGKYITLE